MEIPQIDRSNYLKGLLITAKKNQQLTEKEKEIIRKFSNRLGFSQDFFEEVINNLLINKYINEDPIKFSNIRIAISFIEDALRLTLADEIFSESEIQWLRETGKINSIAPEWIDKKLKTLKLKLHRPSGAEFALYSLI
ncbi:MAG TPA: hypothetical protein VI362_03530 [Ignavibacteriaceae bacterium]|nr:hypothetical protein [Ignavibacteriaceae bacterium]